ncbi:response regulator transcription factor [Labilibaculum euxinus]
MINSNTKVLIVEDEEIFKIEIRRILDSCNIKNVYFEDNYDDALLCLKSYNIDIALIDIFLAGEKTGLSLGQYIRTNYELPFIYLSSNLDSKVMIIAKDTHPDAVIIKPIDEQTLIYNIALVLSNKMTRMSCINILDDRIFIKKDGIYEKVFLKDITYVESNHVYNFLYKKDGSRIMIRGRLKDFYEKFPNCFIQISRGCAINMYYIDHFDRQAVTVNNRVLEIGRKYKNFVHSKLISF